MSKRQTHAGRPIGRMDAAADKPQPVPQTRGFTREQGTAAEDWRRKAPCLPWRLKARGIAPKIFFPASKDDAADAARAKEICAFECPVREECLRFAFDSGCVDGIFGGLDPEERKAVKRKAARGRTGENRRYSDEQRAEVLAALVEALPSHESVRIAARRVGKRFGIDDKTVVRWLEDESGAEASCEPHGDPDGTSGPESAPEAATPPPCPETAALEPSPSPGIADVPAKESANA